MRGRVVVLGAGFGGLELSTILAEEVGDQVDVKLIDRSDAFVFGYSKLDVMFGRTSPEAVRLPYSRIAKPGVTVLREEVTAIDAHSRTVTTDAGTHEADVLVIALGADYDVATTPGLADCGDEFYSREGAFKVADKIARFRSGHAVIAVCDAPFKCPPAPSECALMLHDELTKRGVRANCKISIVLPFQTPVPPSPDASAALEVAFAERGIEFVRSRRLCAVDPRRKAAQLDDGSELLFDLLLAVPKHRAPDVVINSGLTEDGYVLVDYATLRTRYDGVYALGDVATAGVPKAGVFAEGAARIVARSMIAEWTGAPHPGRHLGQGACYIEFGDDRVGRVDIDFLSGRHRTGTFRQPAAEYVAEKAEFGSSRAARWFG